MARTGLAHLKDGEAAAEPLPGQQVAFSRDHSLLWKGRENGKARCRYGLGKKLGKERSSQNSFAPENK